jgi:hypothetical protein
LLYTNNWFLSLNAAEQQSILTAIFKLQAIGPLLGRPDVDALSGLQKVKNLKELRNANLLRILKNSISRKSWQIL